MTNTLRTTALGLALVTLAASAAGARFETQTSFTLPTEDICPGDLYFGGSVLRIDGRLEGSAIAGAQTVTITGSVGRNLIAGAQTVNVAGPVRGDVVAFCANLNVTDTVAGAVRAACASAYVNAPVRLDIVAGCQELTIGKDAVLGGDVIAGCGTMNIGGVVHGGVKAAAGTVIVSGIIDGDLVARVDDKIVLTEDARVFGNLLYTSEKELDLGNPDAVFGRIEFTPQAEPRHIRELKPFKPGLLATFLLPFAILSLLAALAVGFILIAVWKRVIGDAVESCLNRFGRTVGFGALGLFAGPAALLAGLLLIVTIPAAFIGAALYLIFIYLSKAFAGMLIGRWLFRICGGQTASIWLTAPVGILLVYALCAVPFVGWLFWLFAAILGFGVIIEILARTRRC